MTRDAQLAAAVLPGAWTALTLNGGFTSGVGFGLYAPACRLLPGGSVELCGGIGGAFTTGGVAVATLAAQFRPATSIKVGVTTNAATITGFAVITAAGVITITTSAAATAVSLDGEWFRLV